MRQWYYIQSGERHGPVPEPEFREMFEMARLSTNAPVWTEGLEGWKPARDIKGLIPTAHMPPPVPAQKNYAGDNAGRGVAEPNGLSARATSFLIGAPPDDTPSGPQVRPWVRYWARQIDNYLFCFLAGLILAFAYPPATQMNFILLGILLLFVYNFFEPAMFAVLGTTPGKALLKVRVRNQDDSKLSYSEAMNRMMLVYLRGQGLGIPIVTLLTQRDAYYRLMKEGTTSWDENANIDVSHQKIGVLRIVLVVLIVGAMITLSLVGLGMSAAQYTEEGEQAAALSGPPPNSQSVMRAAASPPGAMDKNAQPATQPPPAAMNEYARRAAANTRPRLDASGRPADAADAAQILAEATVLAEQGDAKMQYLVGNIYYAGDVIAKDDATAVAWFWKSAQQGYAEAQVALGNCYMEGAGVREDATQAATWFWNAALQGNLEGQALIGLAYMSGLGVYRDNVQAYTWLTLAAAQDHSVAKARDALAQIMTPEEVAYAQQSAAAFVPTQIYPQQR